MTIKITTPNSGSDALTFGSATTATVAEVTGTEVSSGEGKLELKTTTGGTSAAKVTVLANGNVGIGTTSPDLKMEIVDTSSGASKDGLLLTNYGGASNTETGIFFSPTEAGVIRGARISAYNDGAADSNSVALRFSTGLGAPPVERMRITSAGDLKFNSGFGSVGTAYGCRAWVNFNGTGTVAIRGSGNVSSITDNAVGDYTVNFTTAMPDINYTTTFAGGQKAATWGIYLGYNSYGSAVGSHRFVSTTPADAGSDTSYCSLAFFR